MHPEKCICSTISLFFSFFIPIFFLFLPYHPHDITFHISYRPECMHASSNLSFSLIPHVNIYFVNIYFFYLFASFSVFCTIIQRQVYTSNHFKIKCSTFIYLYVLLTDPFCHKCRCFGVLILDVRPVKYTYVDKPKWKDISKQQLGSKCPWAGHSQHWLFNHVFCAITGAVVAVSLSW